MGRGPGSGRGKTAGRGHKGRGQRSGGNTPPGYEGGQMPLKRRVPKRGFRRLKRSRMRRESFAAVNLGRLGRLCAGADPIDPVLMEARGLVRPGKKVKVLGAGEWTAQVTVRAHAFSESAKRKIAASGARAEVI